VVYVVVTTITTTGHGDGSAGRPAGNIGIAGSSGLADQSIVMIASPVASGSGTRSKKKEKGKQKAEKSNKRKKEAEKGKKSKKMKKRDKRDISSSESENEQGKKSKKKGKSKKKKNRNETSSESEDESSSSSSDSDSSDSDSSSSDTSSSSSDQDRRKKRRKKQKLDLELLEVLWPTEDRPPGKLQDRKAVAYMSMSKLMKLKTEFEKENVKKGVGAAVYGMDKKPKPKRYKAMKDDGETKLHPARFEGQPRLEPAKYWQLVPTTRSEIFRHLPLKHLGIEGVPETAIVKMHNRKVPMELAMLSRETITEVRHVEKAVTVYVMLLHCLHPFDYSGLVLQKVLAESGWARSLGEVEKDKVLLLRRFFDKAARENSGRAVRKEPPMDHEETRTCWMRAVAAAFPQLSFLGVSQQMMALSGAPSLTRASGAAGTSGAVGASGASGTGGRGRGVSRGRAGGQTGRGGSTG
jgi:hypothetical protein